MLIILGGNKVITSKDYFVFLSLQNKNYDFLKVFFFRRVEYNKKSSYKNLNFKLDFELLLFKNFIFNLYHAKKL